MAANEQEFLQFVLNLILEGMSAGSRLNLGPRRNQSYKRTTRNPATIDSAPVPSKVVA